MTDDFYNALLAEGFASTLRSDNGGSSRRTQFQGVIKAANEFIDLLPVADDWQKPTPKVNGVHLARSNGNGAERT